MLRMAMTPNKHSIYEERAQVPFKSKRRLGQGAFGAVDEVELLDHITTQRKQSYARKIFLLPFPALEQKRRLATIRNEVDIIRRVQHIHMIKLVETYIFGREFAIIFEPVAEGTLEDLLEPDNHEQWPSIRVKLQKHVPQWFGCLVSGLSYLHTNKIRHRDIKPSNILILSGNVLLTDFGISLDSPEETHSTYTNAWGTKQYRAPEVVVGKRFGRRADVFALGAVFLEMLTAFIGHDILSRQNDNFPGSYADKCTSISEWIDNIESIGPKDGWYGTMTFLCKTMLQYDPFERPSADDICQCWKYHPFTALPPVSCDCNPIYSDFEWRRIVESVTPENAAGQGPRKQEAINAALRRAMSNDHRLAMAILIGQGASTDALAMTSEMERPGALNSLDSLVSLYRNQRQWGYAEELAKVEKDPSYLLQTLDGHSSSVFAVAFSPDSQLVASASDDYTIWLWDSTTGTKIQHGTLEGHVGSVLAVAFLPDKLIASASRDCTMRLWDITTETPREIFKADLGSLWAVAFSPDGKVIATASDNYTVQLRDSATGAMLTMLTGHSDVVWSIAFSTDGKLIASASREYIQIWDSVTGEPCGTLKGHSGLILGMAFSPNGKLIASASNNETVCLWDLEAGVPYKTLEGHSDAVVAVAFSPDNKFIASASYDYTVRLWDCTTGALHKTLEGHENLVWATAFSPNGELIASASHDATVKLWDYRALCDAQS